MQIVSDFIPCAFWGQIASWCLDMLPYLEERGITRPEWVLKSKIYGDPPDYNIVPVFCETVYAPEKEPDYTLSWEEIHYRLNPKPFDTVGRMFNGDFRKAHEIWSRWFRLNPKVTAATDKVIDGWGIGPHTLAVHYRGTDKMATPSLGETNIVSSIDFISIIDDFLVSHPDITKVFATSDDINFMNGIRAACKDRIEYHEHTAHIRSTTGKPLYFYNKPLLVRRLANECIADFWTLQRCEYCLSNFSAFSAWPKIFNPEQKNYRTNACKPRYWFPHGFTELYKGHAPEIQALLKTLQEGNWTKQDPETGVVL